MLRPYFLHHRQLLGRLCQAGWEVVRELMAEAVADRDLQPGMVAVVHSHGDQLGWHPHVHAIASRGGWDAAGNWMPVPFVGTAAAERLFRHRVIALLGDEGLLSEERIALLLSWRHSGFSVHNAVRVAPGDTAGIERLGRYLLRAPVSMERLEFEAGTGRVDGTPTSPEPGVQLSRPRRRCRLRWSSPVPMGPLPMLSRTRPNAAVCAGCGDA